MSYRFVILALGLSSALCACQSTKGGGPEVLPPGPPITFEPVSFFVPIQSGESRYPNLFSPQSFAVWVSPEVMKIKREKAEEAGEEVEPYLEATAERIEQDYFIFELHLESVFPDSSIAYDAVGLRNMDLYLLTPAGNRIRPIQRVLGSHADEEQREALRLFRRVNIIVFPMRNILQGDPTVAEGAEGVRLAIEGFNSEFYFEWLALPPGETPGPLSALSPEDVYHGAKIGFTELYTKLQALAHLFD